jgi:hypothetical protein
VTTSRQRWITLSLAIVPAVAAVVIIEALHVGLAIGGAGPWRAFTAFAEVAGSGVLQLWTLIILAVGQSLALAGVTAARGCC